MNRILRRTIASSVLVGATLFAGGTNAVADGSTGPYDPIGACGGNPVCNPFDQVKSSATGGLVVSTGPCGRTSCDPNWPFESQKSSGDGPDVPTPWVEEAPLRPGPDVPPPSDIRGPIIRGGK